MSFGRFRDEPSVSKSASEGNSPLGQGAVSNGRDAFLSKGSKISGNLNFVGPAEVDGQVDGEIVAHDRLTIGESAVINAKISGSEITVKGIVIGDISASRKLILKKPARVQGSIVAPVLSIEDGVLFEGKVSMPQPVVKPEHGDKVQSEKIAELRVSSVENKPQTQELGIKISSSKGSGIF